MRLGRKISKAIGPPIQIPLLAKTRRCSVSSGPTTTANPNTAIEYLFSSPIPYRTANHSHSLCSPVLMIRSSKKEARVILRDVTIRRNAQRPGGLINPTRRAFDLGKVADRGFVEHDAPVAIIPLGAKFLIMETRVEPKSAQDGFHFSSIFDAGFGFHPCFMTASTALSFMSQDPLRPKFPQSQQFPPTP